MSDLVMGVLFFLMPGMVPIWIQTEKRGVRESVAVRIVSICLYDFAAMLCAYGLCLLLFGEQTFSSAFGKPEGAFASRYLLLYVVYLTAAYLTALLLSVMKGALTHRNMYLRRYTAVCTVLLGALAAGIGYDGYAGKHIMISEVCGNNLTIVLDQYGENSDYIELYNPSATSVSLNGFVLAKEAAAEGARLDGYYLEPHGYLLLYANGRAETASNSIALRIGAEGEELYLYDGSGSCVDSVCVPELPVDTVYARMGEDMGSWDTARYGSPGEDNLTLTAYTVPTLYPPVFSAGSGFYAEAFQLSMECQEGETIYYTLDGQTPTTQSQVYTEPVWIRDVSGEANYYAAISGLSARGDYAPEEPVDKACVVQAICVNREGEVSEIASAVYFIGYDEKDGYDGVKILAMNVEPADLFSDERGIYRIAHYEERGKTAERTARVTLFDSERLLCLEGKVGIRIHGGSTRDYRQKGFNFYGREEYAEETLDLGKYMLRTSGAKDTYLTMLRDVFNQSLVEDRAVAIQRGEPCVLFLNGEYWGLYNLQERYSAAYFEEYYGIPENNLIVLKDSRADDVTTTKVSVGREADREAYEELLDYAREKDLGDPENYQEICTMMDVQSFIDYFAAEMYVGNTDWPVNNVCRFRSREIREGSAYEDGRWRWALYDTDESTGGGSTGYDMNPFEGETYYHKQSPMETELMANLLNNEEFRRQFSVVFMDMINKNFAYSEVHDKLYEMAEVYAQPMVNSYHRFNQEEYTLDTFWDYIAVIDEYMKNRAGYVITYLAEAMGLSGNTGVVTLQAACVAAGDREDLELFGEGGCIVLNTITPTLEQGEWQGTYLTDYPVTVTAQAAEGYRFVRWEGSCESTEETIEAEVPEEGICLRAVFEPLE